MAKANFEDNMENLEKIVTELEKGELNLDDSISKFEEGIKISKECNKILEEAEKKITIGLESEQYIRIHSKQIYIYTIFFVVCNSNI